jgi:hypothetical protein
MSAARVSSAAATGVTATSAEMAASSKASAAKTSGVPPATCMLRKRNGSVQTGVCQQADGSYQNFLEDRTVKDLARHIFILPAAC